MCVQYVCESKTLQLSVELVRNLVAHGNEREGKWRGNWRMEWVASTLTPPPNVVYPALLKLMHTPQLPAVDWTDTLTDLNGLVRFRERRNLVSARVPSRSARAIPTLKERTEHQEHEETTKCRPLAARPKEFKSVQIRTFHTTSVYLFYNNNWQLQTP